MKVVSKNPNHPQKGRQIAVAPIRDEKDVKAIKQLLSDRPRDLLLFTMGVNNGLRVGDLLKLKVKDVRHLKQGDTIPIKEGKTKMIATISKDNNPSLKSANRSDSKKVGEIVQIRFLGLKYDYISKKALKDLQTP